MTTTLGESKSVTRRRALAAIATPAAAAAGAAWWFGAYAPGRPVSDAIRPAPKPTIKPKVQPPPPPSRADVRREAGRRATTHLDWAEEKSRKLVADCLAPIGAFFDEAKRGVPDFADDALSLKSKAYMAADHVWHWSSGNWQRTYLEERWQHHLFSIADLTQVLERVAKRYADGVNDIEQKMLVRLRIDVEDLPREALPELADEKRLAAGFRGAIEKAVEHARADVGHEIGLFLVAEIAERVLLMVARQLGLSAGLLAGGAAASPYSAGLSLAGALIINYLLDLVWNWCADPQGKLVDEIGSQLERLRRLIVEGDGGGVGMRGELEEYARRRSLLRSKALGDLLSPQK